MRFLRRAAIVIGITFVAYLVADWSVGAYFAYRDREAPPNPAGIPGYKGEPYAVPEFGLEAQQSAPLYTIPGTRLLWPQEYHGQFFNIDRLPPTDSYYRKLEPRLSELTAVSREGFRWLADAVGKAPAGAAPAPALEAALEAADADFAALRVHASADFPADEMLRFCTFFFTLRNIAQDLRQMIERFPSSL